MSNSVKTYTDLITSQHKDKPKYMATVAANVQVLVRIQQVIESLNPKFDLDVALGAQLDIIGEWVGISRIIAIPLVGIYFEWDGADSVGWEYGIWQGVYDPTTGTINLPDDIYLTLIRGKIAANHWDGTIPGAYDVLAVAFPNQEIIIQDNQDMSMIVAVAGAPISTILKALIVGGYIPLKPEGVRVDYFFNVIDAPMFAWDLSTPNLDGWGTGSWGENF